MNFLRQLYEIMHTTVDVPQSYGTYHLTCVALTLIAAVLLIATLKNAKEKTVRVITAIVWVVIVVLEIGKQLLFSVYTDASGSFGWDYYWYFLPFQFCSSPLYILPIVAFAKNGKLRDAAIVFLGTFSVFAGTCVMVFPGDVFLWFDYINIQTMVHHGSQIFFGAYLAFRYRDKLNFKNLARATAIFATLCAIALVLDVGAYHLFPVWGIDEIFNMFFISPYFNCTLPLLSEVDKLLPYPAFLCVYVFGFMLCAGLIMLIMKGLIKITGISKQKVTNT